MVASRLRIPLGRRVPLGDRGTTFVREISGPAGAPTLVLLHGWVASGGLNWFQVFEPLGRAFRVLAPDLRGHGRGIRTPGRFRLADCADDVAALLDELAIPSAIMVGYSMGGPVAELLWRRHPAKVDGLVLCATGSEFVRGAAHRVILTTAMTAFAGTTRAGELATYLPRALARQVAPLPPVASVASFASRGRPSTLQLWSAAEMRRHDWRLVLEAGHALARYDAAGWIGEIDVPTAVLITTRDLALEPHRQAKLAASIPEASIHRVEAGHAVCASQAFAPPLLGACRDVAARVDPSFAVVADR